MYKNINPALACKSGINTKRVLIGLIILLAFTLAIAGGRKPVGSQSKPEEVQVLRKAREIFDNRFGITEEKRQNHPAEYNYPINLNKLTNPLLETIFPNCQFYQAIAGITTPPSYELVAFNKEHGYAMPSDFNELLVQFQRKITDNNSIEIAKAFVLAADPHALLGTQFSNASLIDEDNKFFPGDQRAAFRIKLTSWSKLNGVVTEWRFNIVNQQFWCIERKIVKTFVGEYIRVDDISPPPAPAIQTFYLTIQKWSDKELIKQNPSVTVVPASVIIANNGVTTPVAQRQVTVQLRDFQPNSLVSISIRTTSIGGLIRTIVTNPVNPFNVQVDTNGNQDVLVTVDGSSPTGIAQVTAQGLPMNVVDTLIVEKTKSGSFRPGYNYALYYISQAFEFDESRTETFSNSVRDATISSYNKQVTDWSFQEPPDANNNHEISINDGHNLYHGSNSTEADGGPDRMIYVQSNIHSRFPAYSTEAAIIQSAVLHEFYHGIQWGLNNWKWPAPNWQEWNWFLEGQARFLQTAGFPAEEFLSGRLYPDDANTFLLNRLNTSLRFASYQYCLYWRFLFENYKQRGSTANKLSIIRDAYRATNSVGNNSISDGAIAMNNALSTGGGRFTTFAQSIDSFAVGCYLNNPCFGRWFDPNRVYVRPILTVDTAFRTNTIVCDSIVVYDSVRSAFGFDFIQVRLNQEIDTLEIYIDNDPDQNGGTALNPIGITFWYDTRIDIENQIKNFPPPTLPGEYRIRVFPVATMLPQKIYVRRESILCLAIIRYDTLENERNGKYLVKMKIIRDVGVTSIIPRIDTLVAGINFTPKAVVRNNGWIKEIFPVTFKIGDVYSNTKICTLLVNNTKTINFTPWNASMGRFATICSVYISSDTSRRNDTLRGHLTVLRDTWLVKANSLRPIGYGGSLTSVGDTHIYALAGNSRAFMRYDVKNNNWAFLCSLPAVVTTGGSLDWLRGTDFIYALRPGGNNPLYRYHIRNNTWTLDTNFSFIVLGPASVMCYARYNDSNYLYIITGHVSHTSKFMRYHLSRRRVDFLSRYPDTIGAGVSLCWDRSNYLYMLRGGNNYFYRYDLGSNTWNRMANTSFWVGNGGALTYYPFTQKVWAWNGRHATSATTVMMEYSPNSNSWVRYANPPQRADFGGALTTANNLIYGMRGGGYTDFWQYYPVIGAKELASIDEVTSVSLPLKLISSIAPNPFKSQTTIRYSLPVEGKVSLAIYDVSGRLVKTLVNEHKKPGIYSTNWNGTDNQGKKVSQGIYFYTLKADGQKTQKKMLMLR